MAGWKLRIYEKSIRNRTMKMTKIAKEVLYKNDFFAKRYDKTCGAVYIAKYGNGHHKNRKHIQSKRAL